MTWTDDEKAQIVRFDPWDGEDWTGDLVTFRDAIIVGRKVHKCSHCGGPVAIGEAHRVQESFYDGEFQRHRWCNACCDAMLHYDDDDPYDLDPEDPPYGFRIYEGRRDRFVDTTEAGRPGGA